MTDRESLPAWWTPPSCPGCDKVAKPKDAKVMDNWGHPWHEKCWFARVLDWDTYRRLRD